MKNSNGPILFLDRDGTINQEVNYLSDPRDLRILPGVPEAIRRFNQAGWTVIVVTNQSGVGRGYFTQATVNAIHAQIQESLNAADAHIDAFYICPHHPDDHCPCRKPKAYLYQQAIRDLHLTPQKCVIVGDKMTDLEPGRQLDFYTILVETGYGIQQAANLAPQDYHPDLILPDLLGVAQRLLNLKTPEKHD